MGGLNAVASGTGQWYGGKVAIPKINQSMKTMIMLAAMLVTSLMLTTGCATHNSASACDGSCCKDAAKCAACCGDAAGCAKCCKKS
jgi:hypothetical protein